MAVYELGMRRGSLSVSSISQACDLLLAPSSEMLAISINVSGELAMFAHSFWIDCDTLGGSVQNGKVGFNYN